MEKGKRQRLNGHYTRLKDKNSKQAQRYREQSTDSQSDQSG